ncbi:hypothetical protein WH221_06600 [Chryseobacterium culicis]|uniref:Uncharacterized protein n=1 Tax=Chryseobacterium culicis TaxID=680127 RepID=A0A2S9CZM7_CHRCI|nr:hypothetical protein [Chryseobacterium culicis]PRB85911.1 hypothetical protein CQ022_06565 [Chryseobacterium culicis]PRB91664.1 hypothetical protein CQ033_00235 [Chryseobacterium culicis]
MSKKIIVPKNKEAEIALDYDVAGSDQIVELSITNGEFKKLWDRGIFILINKISNSNIDDFEDEHITNLDSIYNSLNELKKNSNSSNEINRMFELALSYGTSIHFYF